MQGEDRMEAELTALARATTYPETPDLAAGFWSRLQEQREARTPAPAWRLALVAAMAAVVVLAAVISTVAPARDAAADLVSRINIFRVDENAIEDITRDIAGEEVSLAEAEARLGRPIALPNHPSGVQDSVARIVYRDFPPHELRIVALLFEPPVGEPFVLFATNGFAGKGLAPGATAEPVDELKDEAYWLEGLRVVHLYAEDGLFVDESQRATEANTLIWVQGGYVYRIEGELDRAEAIAIARSVR